MIRISQKTPMINLYSMRFSPQIVEITETINDSYFLHMETISTIFAIIYVANPNLLLNFIASLRLPEL